MIFEPTTESIHLKSPTAGQPMTKVTVRVPTLWRWIEIEHAVEEPSPPMTMDEPGGVRKPDPKNPRYLLLVEMAKYLRVAMQVVDAQDMATHDGSRPLSMEALRTRGEALMKTAHAGFVVAIYQYLKLQVWGVGALRETFPRPDGVPDAGDAGVRADGLDAGAVVATGATGASDVVRGGSGTGDGAAGA